MLFGYDTLITPFERFGRFNPEADSRLVEYVFRALDTISDIAHRFYGDWRLWRVIAERNNITDVRVIEPGTVLLIPPRPLEKGRYGQRNCAAYCLMNPHAIFEIDGQAWDSWAQPGLFKRVSVDLTTGQCSEAIWDLFDPDFQHH